MIWLEFAIMQRALIACIFAGFLMGLIGVFVVRMRLSAIGYSMSHGAFAGAALGVATATNPLVTGLLFASGTALVIGPIADKARLHADTITSIVFPLNMALAFVFLTLTPEVGLSSQVANVLWGSIISMTNSDLLYLTTLFAVTLAVVYFVWKELFAIMFNRKLAEADGINTKPFVYLIIFLAGVVITFSLKLVGGLLIYALLFNPASTVLQFSENMRKVVIASPLVGMATTVTGLVVSLFFDLPVGSCIVIVSTIVFVVALLLSPKRKRKEEPKK
ncbi:MAG: metal ABC transporter permease [Candidatus Bathyarchaeota archaeon]|nr:metal ABC transporter permease [Candidatus Bathyarchaeum tardum]WGM89393.1 MAG: metal ABC transporter permease [Candidatus Bathyarchaeum tardum]WNZ28327.1 MAG: metal ABC transporter permease [Candidatus Bathyarchaeota archaeon]